MDIFVVVSNKNLNDEDIFYECSLTKVRYLYPYKNNKFLYYEYSSTDILIYSKCKKIKKNYKYKDFSKKYNFNFCRDLYEIFNIKCNKNFFMKEIKDEISDISLWIQKLITIYDINLSNIISFGSLELCQWFYSKGCVYDDESFNLAIQDGYIDICKWLFEIGCPDNENSSDYAITSGSVEICEWYLKENIFIYNFDLNTIMQHYNLDICKWLYYKLNIKENGYIINFNDAILNPSIDVCKWLYYDLNVEYDDDTFNIAVEYDFLEKCKWLYYDLNVEYDDDTFDIAIEYGSLKLCKWLIEIGCDYNFINYSIAEKNQRKDICKWLYEIGCPRLA